MWNCGRNPPSNLDVSQCPHASVYQITQRDGGAGAISERSGESLLQGKAGGFKKKKKPFIWSESDVVMADILTSFFFSLY